MNCDIKNALRKSTAAVLLAAGLLFGGSLDDVARCKPRQGWPHFFGKLAAKEPVTIAYIGGSITEQQGWRDGTFDNFVKTYPDVEFTQINSAIPGTNSQLGAARIDRDVLSKDPDLVFIEFAVNDGNSEYSQKTFEGMVRKIYDADINTDICFVYTIWNGQIEKYLYNGRYQPSASGMEVVAEHYGVPSIHMAFYAAKLLREDKLVFKAPLSTKDKIAFSPDGVHPYTQTGHPLYTRAVVDSLVEIENASTAGERIVPLALHKDDWQDAKLVSLSEVRKSESWQEITTKKSKLFAEFGKFMPRIWMADKNGSSISFAFKGTAVGIYGIKGPDVGMLKIELDSREPELITFFDSYCTAGRYKLKSVMLAYGLSDDVHRVKITVDEAMPDKAAILAKGGNEYKDNEEFNSRKAYIGDIIINGELTEFE
ncbi:MAG: SGNH/GDSL hydrolase family protein [Sedimentisphaeraceae bacterium JB056]